MRFLYAVSQAHGRKGQSRGDGKHVVYDDYNFNITRNEFIQFMKFYNKDLSD